MEPCTQKHFDENTNIRLVIKEKEAVLRELQSLNEEK
jgi:hypothetical protein